MFPLIRSRAGFSEQFLEDTARSVAREVISEILGASDWDILESTRHKDVMRELGNVILRLANSNLVELLE